MGMPTTNSAATTQMASPSKISRMIVQNQSIFPSSTYPHSILPHPIPKVKSESKEIGRGGYGEGGIRTREAHKALNCVWDSRHQPLGHLSPDKARGHRLPARCPACRTLCNCPK